MVSLIGSSSPFEADPFPAAWQGVMQAQGSEEESLVLDEPIGQIGGVTRAMLVRGSQLLIGQGPRIAEIDLSDPRRPRLLGVGPRLDGIVRGLMESDGSLIAIAGDALFTLEADEPLGAPHGRLYLGLPATDLAVHEDHAYLKLVTPNVEYPDHIDTASLAIIDLTDIRAPRMIGQRWLPEPEIPIDLLVSADRLYLSAYESWFMEPIPEDWPGVLRVYDLADPSRPQELVRIEDPSIGLMAVHPDGARPSTIYAMGANHAAWDLADLNAPTKLAQFGNPQAWYGTLSMARMVDSDLHLLVDHSSGLYSFTAWEGSSINRFDPELMEPRDLHYSHDHFSAAAIGEDNNLISITRGGQLAIIRPPSLDDVQARGEVIGHLGLVGPVWSVAMSPGDSRRLHYGGISSLGLVDGGDPHQLQPRRVLDLSYAGSFNVQATERLLALQHTFAENDCLWHRSHMLYSLEVPDAPRLSGKLCVADGGFYTPAAFDGDWAFTHGWAVQADPSFGSSYDQIGSWDTSDLAQPRFLHGRNLGGYIGGLALAGELLVVAKTRDHPFGRSGQQRNEPTRLLLDILDSGQPELPTITTLDLGETPARHASPVVATGGGLAFVLAEIDGDEGRPRPTRRLFIVSIEENPPRFLQQLELRTSSYRPIWSAGYLFIGRTIIDVRDPSSARVVGQIPRAVERLNTIAVRNGLVHVAAGDHGIEIYRPPLDWLPASDQEDPPLLWERLWVPLVLH